MVVRDIKVMHKSSESVEGYATTISEPLIGNASYVSPVIVWKELLGTAVDIGKACRVPSDL
jgi:hypothetical protein